MYITITYSDDPSNIAGGNSDTYAPTRVANDIRTSGGCASRATVNPTIMFAALEEQAFFLSLVTDYKKSDGGKLEYSSM